MPTITDTLENIAHDVVLPALSAAFPFLAAILNIPIVGSLVTKGFNAGMDWLISHEIIEVKIGIIDYMDAAALKKYNAFMPILKQYQTQQKNGAMSAQDEAAYDQALQDLVKNHPGVVNA